MFMRFCLKYVRLTIQIVGHNNIRQPEPLKKTPLSSGFRERVGVGAVVDVGGSGHSHQCPE
jgi:hypothetical protein